jgi:hypothetical protein
MYLDNVKYLLDNYIFSTYEDEFKYIAKDGTEFLIAKDNFYISDLLRYESYTLPNTYTTYHNPDFIKLLRGFGNCNYMDFDNAVLQDKPVLLQMELHPGDHDFDEMLKHYFRKLFLDKRVLTGLREGSVRLILYFGFEADSFSSKEFQPIGTHRSYYEMFDTVIDEYSLPKNSIIVLSSNSLGELQEKEHYKNKNTNLGTIFANMYERNTFVHSKGDVNFDYTFDEHLENIHNSKNKVLRVSRTQHYSRDIMLYYLYKSHNEFDTIIEQNKFYDDVKFFKMLDRIKKISKKLGFNIEKYFEYNNTDLLNLKSKLPYIASEYEKLNSLDENVVYSNETIPHDIYYNSICSWVSTSIPDRNTQVFINSSTFNPMLYYHPLIFHGNSNTKKELNRWGYKSYDFFTNDNDLDSMDDDIERLAHSINTIDKIYNTSKNQLIQMIADSRDILEYNRSLLFECKSIEHTLTKLYDLLNE